MKSDWYKKYWKIGFSTRLYDLLAPEAYLDCFRKGVEFVPDMRGKTIFDAGCGSGLLLRFLTEQLKSRYIGTDILWSGASATTGKGGLVVQSDLLEGLAVRENSIDVVFAFFFSYTFSDSGNRKKLMRNLRHILRPGGKLILVNPSRTYNPRNIIRVSLEAIRKRDGLISWWIKRYLVYPWTLQLGLNHVENQLKSDKWHAYKQDELCEEIEEAGFRIKHVEPLYANSAFLVVAE